MVWHPDLGPYPWCQNLVSNAKDKKNMNRFDIEYNSLRLCWYFLSFLLFGFLHVFFAFGPARKSGKILIPKLVMTR